MFKYDNIEIDANWENDNIKSGFTFIIKQFEKRKQSGDTIQSFEHSNLNIDEDRIDDEDYLKEISEKHLKSLSNYNINIELMQIENKNEMGMMLKKLSQFSNEQCDI
jgi:hypothetical protein